MKGHTMLQSDIATPTRAKSPSARKERPMAHHRVPAGLCQTCVHAPTCTYPRRDGQSVLHCGEFEGETARAAAPSATARVTPPSDATRAEPPLGLCSNCDLYADCQYPKAEGGVWQCGEYR